MLRILLLAGVIVGGYFAYSLYGDALFAHKLSYEEREIRDEIEALQHQKDELEVLRDYLQTDLYIEGVARRVLGLVRPGERLYVIESDAPLEPTPGAEEPEQNKSWWERLYSGE